MLDRRVIARAPAAALAASLLAALAAFTAAACGGASGNSNCDPTTIVARGRCYWEKNQACDAISCVPPDECVVIEGKPASVECKKQK